MTTFSNRFKIASPLGYAATLSVGNQAIQKQKLARQFGNRPHRKKI
jgi:hypothetical protein